MKSVKTLVVVFLAVATLTSCSSGGSNSPDENNSQTSESTVTSSSESSSINDDSGCPSSSRENPISGEVKCKSWDLSISDAGFVSDELILAENRFNDVSENKSWLVVTVTAKYKGDGKGSLSDVLPVRSFLIGKNNSTYSERVVVNDGLEEKYGFGPDRINATNPYSGGTTKVSLWYMVEKTDSDFALAFFVDPNWRDDPNLWLKVNA